VDSRELVEWRERNSCSQDILSMVLGVDIITISRWERDVQKIPSFLHFALKYLEQNGDLITDAIDRRKEQRRIQRERRIAERRLQEKAAALEKAAAEEKRAAKRRKSARRVSKRRATD
jgi:transcriptional regulator with XRE-family HTH domain